MFTTFLSWSNQLFFGKFINKNEEYKPEQSPYQLKLSNTFISGSGLFISYASGRRKKQKQTEEPKQTRGVNLSRIFFSFGSSPISVIFRKSGIGTKKKSTVKANARLTVRGLCRNGGPLFPHF